MSALGQKRIWSGWMFIGALGIEVARFNADNALLIFALSAGLVLVQTYFRYAAFQSVDIVSRAS